jgi:signal transduction histidine kinase
VLANICLLYVVAFITSYTGGLLRKNKEKLREQNTELERSRTELKMAAERLEEKNVKLTMAVDKARESDRMKSEFLANMSHELRTPLNHIIGFTELVLDKNFGELNKVQEEYLTDVDKSSKHLLSLINDILDLSKVEAGKLDLELSDLNLKMLLESSLVILKEKAIRHSIDLKLDLNAIPEIISADERKLKQILYNLLSNAVKFSQDSGQVNISTKQVIIPTDGNQQTAIEISVRDTGIGIRQEDLERIFDPFEQADNSASRRYQGTGLGLSLTKKLVELHGGKIWAESEGEGKGSTFSFIILT